MLVNGIHHVCIKCRKDQVEKVKEFYTEVLGLPVVRSWGEPELAGFVFDSGAGLIEVFTNAQEDCRRAASVTLRLPHQMWISV